MTFKGNNTHGTIFGGIISVMLKVILTFYVFQSFYELIFEPSYDVTREKDYPNIGSLHPSMEIVDYDSFPVVSLEKYLVGGEVHVHDFIDVSDRFDVYLNITKEDDEGNILKDHIPMVKCSSIDDPKF